MNAATLAAPFRFDGVGLHSGAQASIEVRPADPGAGYTFRVGDKLVPAIADFAQESPLATVIGHTGTSISTIEHILSALVAMGCSDAEIALDGPEIPILDGSARLFADAIANVGLRELPIARPVFAPSETLEFRDGDRVVIIMPSNEFRVRVVSDFAAPIGTHYVDATITPEYYRTQIAPARTFAFLRDVEAMRARGLARGGNLENALVFAEDGPMQPLQWPNEVARHKVLDLIGDFALLGAWPQCEVVAIKSGHALHTRITRELRNRVRTHSAS